LFIKIVLKISSLNKEDGSFIITNPLSNDYSFFIHETLYHEMNKSQPQVGGWLKL